MADIPSNEKLWDMIVLQAKSRFRTYPSPAASAWVRQHYEQAGGHFVQSRKDVDDKQKRPAEKKDD